MNVGAGGGRERGGGGGMGGASRRDSGASERLRVRVRVRVRFRSTQHFGKRALIMHHLQWSDIMYGCTGKKVCVSHQ
jgi:hypothetical protein